MKVQNITNIDKFFEIVDSCKGKVELVTGEGDRLNLKSKLSQYVSMANIFSNGEIPELEIIAYEKEDIDKLVNLLILQHIIIIGRSQFHDKRIVEILAHLQFIIQFIAPDIFRTLGYANDKLPRLLSTTGQQHNNRYIYNKV